MNSANAAIQYLNRSIESNRFIKERRALQNEKYFENNAFKSERQYADLLELLEDLNKQQRRCQAWMELNNAQTVLNQAMQAEQIDMDTVLMALDQFNFAKSIADEKILEVEAIASAYIARIYYRCFKKVEKSANYYRQSIRICNALKPRSFIRDDWYKEMMKDMVTIDKQVDQRERDAELQETKQLREENKKEVDELWAKKEEGAHAFIKYCIANYNNWKNQKVEIKDDELTDGQLKKTILKVIFQYHPDRKNQDKERVFNAKDVFIRNEITTIFNKILTEFKLNEGANDGSSKDAGKDAAHDRTM